MIEPFDLTHAGLISFAITRDPHAGWVGHWLHALPSHRMEYLEYEGPVSGDRGLVTRVATGNFLWHANFLDQLILDVIDMDFLEPPFTPWPTGRYCLTRGSSPSPSMWLLEFAGSL